MIQKREKRSSCITWDRIKMVHSLNCLRTLNMAMVITGLSTPMAEKVGDMNPVQSRSIIKNEQNIGKVAQKEATNYERFQGIY